MQYFFFFLGVRFFLSSYTQSRARSLTTGPGKRRTAITVHGRLTQNWGALNSFFNPFCMNSNPFVNSSVELQFRVNSLTELDVALRALTDTAARFSRLDESLSLSVDRDRGKKRLAGESNAQTSKSWSNRCKGCVALGVWPNHRKGIERGKG